MEVIRDQSRCPRPPEGTAVTIGAYDGVHVGHRAVIAQLRRKAESQGLRTAVVTFDRHPASIVRPESAPRQLTDLDQKLELLGATGIDYCLVVTFDEERSQETAEEFVREVLAGCLNARLVAVGEDFHFGHKREGDVGLLRTLGAHYGFLVDSVDLVDAFGRPATDAVERVSSTRIRTALETGDLGKANALLGRPYEVRGTVVRGDARGAEELGFPTANLAVPGQVLLPADGIYAGWYERPDGEVYPAALSVGRRPTFYDHADASLLEAHLLDFEGNLYNEQAEVRFVGRLRGEERFETVHDLVEQMRQDCADARRVLGIG
jgi:riboflavin kinase / FMN adenylyltransferase